MEEINNTNPEQFNVSGKKAKKKGMRPLKGLLLAVLIVFLICVIGLLIRMVVADDGDYFKPIKQIFGIEGEEDDDEKKSSNNISKDKEKDNKDKNKSSLKSASRYRLLSDDVDDKDVKHYRLSIDMGDFFDKFMEEMNSKDTPFNYENDENTFNDYDSDSFNVKGLMETYMELVQQLGDVIDGEMYFDIYFEGNEIIQIVIGYDYGKLLENMYEYLLDMNEDEMEDEGIESIEDLADYIQQEFENELDEDKLYEMILDYSDEDIEEQLKQFGIKEKDIKDAIDFNVDTGLIEIYINGTTKVKALVSMGLESNGFQEQLKEMKKETKTKIDEDNIIESILEAANEKDEYSDFGFEFIEVK